MGHGDFVATESGTRSSLVKLNSRLERLFATKAKQSFFLSFKATGHGYK